MAARCEDPNCSCRSPDLERFTNTVLRRDAARTDYLVIPLIGGVLANCFLADAEIEGPQSEIGTELLDLARSVRDLAAAARDGKSWEDETHAYGIIANLVFCEWPELLAWGSMSWFRTTLGLGWSLRASHDITAVVRALGADPAPSWTESVIIAAFAASTAGRGGKNRDFHLLGKVGRPLRVVLADRMRRANLTSWPAALSAAIDDWNVPMLQRFARSQAKTGDAAILYVSDLEDAAKAKLEAQGDSVVAPPEPEPAPSPRDTGESQAAEQLIEGAIVEINHWRTQRDRVQQERDKLADRDARHRSHIESLERELQSARSAVTRLESQLVTARQERNQFAERIAAYEALEEDAPPSSDPAPDTFAGRRVLVFTGAENADARTAFAQSFHDLGATQVDCYWADRSRGPDVFPADAIVAVDVSFMSHSTWNAIQDRVRAAGAWCYFGKHGAATLSRATAAAWNAHRARM
jgi:hypothetical protein